MQPNIKQLYLLRHGEPVGGDGRIRGRTDDLLTELGWQQMLQATQRMSVEAIYASPLHRCADFARFLAQTHQLPLEVDTRLIEMGMGSWEGKAKQEVLINPEFQWNYTRNPQGYLPKDAESFEHIRQRAKNWLTDYSLRPETDSLVIAHAGIIRFILAELLQMPVESALRIKLPFAASLHITIQINHLGLIGQLNWPKH